MKAVLLQCWVNLRFLSEFESWRQVSALLKCPRAKRSGCFWSHALIHCMEDESLHHMLCLILKQNQLFCCVQSHRHYFHPSHAAVFNNQQAVQAQKNQTSIKEPAVMKADHYITLNHLHPDQKDPTEHTTKSVPKEAWRSTSWWRRCVFKVFPRCPPVIYTCRQFIIIWMLL